MAVIQTQGVHHITFVGSNRQAIIDFYQGVLGMPLIFEQPNLDVPDELHLYFDPGDGRLITFFVRPTRANDPTPNPQDIGNLHHIAKEQLAKTKLAKQMLGRNAIAVCTVDGSTHLNRNNKAIQRACANEQPKCISMA